MRKIELMEHMNPHDLRERTMVFALRVLEVVDALPKSIRGRNAADQLCRSGTSVAANYRAAKRAKSTADFIHKMGTVEEEADEVLFWLELIVRSEMIPAARLQPLMKEADEIIAIIVSSINTAKKSRN
jgi:four helix bundle protein